MLEAILLNNLWYWIAKNKANNVNFFDGYYWTYNSTRAFNELFPYVSQRQIQNALKHLKEEGILQTGNYNKISYDRTLWYAFTKKGECIMQKCKMEDAEMLNGNSENVKPIPNNKPIDKTNSKPNNNKEENVPYEKIKNLYHEICVSYPKLIKLSDNRKTAIAARFKEYNYNIEIFRTLFMKAEDSEFLKGNTTSWKADFDWLMNQSNMTKVLEDRYKNEENKNEGNNKHNSNECGEEFAQFG